jgi:hypothetical protein
LRRRDGFVVPHRKDAKKPSLRGTKQSLNTHKRKSNKKKPYSFQLAEIASSFLLAKTKQNGAIQGTKQSLPVYISTVKIHSFTGTHGT